MSRSEEACALVRQRVAERGWTDEIERDARGWLRGALLFTADQFAEGSFYLAKVIGELCQQHRDIGRSHPPSLTDIEWRAILTRIANGLLEYADAPSVPNLSTVAYARESMRLFAEWFDYLVE